MKVKISRCTGQAFALTVLLFLVTASATQAQQQRPELFTYAELVQLYENKDQHHLAMRTNGACECATELGDDISPAGRKIEGKFVDADTFY